MDASVARVAMAAHGEHGRLAFQVQAELALDGPAELRPVQGVEQGLQPRPDLDLRQGEGAGVVHGREPAQDLTLGLLAEEAIHHQILERIGLERRRLEPLKLEQIHGPQTSENPRRAPRSNLANPARS